MRPLFVPLIISALALTACSSGDQSTSEPPTSTQTVMVDPSTTAEAAPETVSVTEHAPAEVVDRDASEFQAGDYFYSVELKDSPYQFICLIPQQDNPELSCFTDYDGTSPAPMYSVATGDAQGTAPGIYFDPVMGYSPALLSPFDGIPPGGTLAPGEKVTIGGHTFTREGDTVTVSNGAHNFTVTPSGVETNSLSLGNATNMTEARLGESCGTVTNFANMELKVYPLNDYADCQAGLDTMSAYFGPHDDPMTAPQGSGGFWDSPDGAWSCARGYALPYLNEEVGANMSPTCSNDQTGDTVVAVDPAGLAPQL